MSSTSKSKFKYDVFISFRGTDVRDGFLSHLFHALCHKQIVTFKDDNLDRGEEISPSLLRVIEESYVALIIFSENYVNSPWCLDELVKIVDCRKRMGQVVVPIFYHVGPTDVRELTGTYGDAFTDKLESWRNALRETVEISGFESRIVKPESKLIEEIVSLVHKRVNHTFSCVSIDDGLVGIDSRVNDITSKLCTRSEDIWFLGIWGMGGIGKTTVARKIYDQISSDFESAYFVASVRERLKKYTLHDLKHEILSELLGKEIPNLRRHDIVASSFIWKWIKSKKILIVLDDVSDLEQIEQLIGKHDMYSPGSRVIMTSRDKQILMSGGADEICEVEKLNNREALQLLSLHAFRQHSPSEEYIELAEKLIAYAKGIPLALKVLGSSLHNKNTREWEDQLKKLEIMADKRIQNILKISYDELDYMEQEIFLDIACFFKGEDRHHAESILQGCGFNAGIGIGALLDKALITISENKLDMHDLLQQMGRDIVREERIEEPWTCSRLWVAQDICNILTKDLEDVCVKSISLDLSKSGVLDLSCNVFRRMKRLRLLKFYNPYYPKEGVYSSCNGVIRIKRPRYLPCQQHAKGILNSLPDELRYLYWYGYPSKALPLKFCPKNLVQLHLVRSHVEQLCIKNQYFESLKLMDLSYSVKLIRIADLSNFPKLEILHLRGCTSLVEIQSTKSYDSELRHLNLERCRSLCYFSSFLYMKRLDFLSVEGCFKITEFPVIPRMIKCLILSKTAVKQVPWSIEHFTQLTKLDLKSCTNLETLPSNIGELHLLERLNLEGCSKLMNLPDSTCSLKSLKSLSINECRNLRELPEKIGDLKSLEKLDATRSGLRILPPSINILVKLEFLSCSGCRGLILPPFTGLPSLKMLLLQDCGLSEISESLGSLKSLWGLYLGGNNLKKLPVAIKQLSELRRLYLRGNKRLEYIPELPSTLEDLWVQNSTCLQRMLSFTEVNMNFLQVLDSRNCINLDKSWGRKIMDDVLLGIENMLPQLRHFRKQDQVFCKEVLVCGLSIAVCLAGDELPPRMKHKNENGSTIFISMEPIPVDFIVVVFSAVVASTDNEAETAIEFSESGHAFDLQFATEPRINCQSRFMTESGCTLNKCCSRAVFWDNYFKPKYAPIIEHTLVWVYIFHLKDKHRFTEASFRFAAQTESSNFRVKKCGVHVLYSVDSHEIPPLHVPSLGWSSHSTSFVSLT
ncbi:Disease resistance protein (TIR-NBS-LRR class) family [Euphorbia peplus]|nr:Disease resistance protein (TIR-NBS-LRR class) family [Euphorbia peplus]